MTLGRQLLTGIATSFAALLVGFAAIHLSVARDYLEQQLDAHANETATSLALALGTRMSALDQSLLETMVRPVFDRGHFQTIEIRTPGGERVLARELGPRDLGVPAWFSSMVLLEGPAGEALISSGWRQLGRVIVRVHPSYAYQQLFDTALATLALLGSLLALALIAMRFHLAGILRPLLQIEQAALAISNRQFVTIDIKPRARELQRVTHAINSLSGKIRHAIGQESACAERLRREAYEDKVTGRLNRRGFEQSVLALLGDGSEIHSGALALFALSGMEEVNRIFGPTRGDAVLKHLADLLAAPDPGGAAIVGRWTGTIVAAFLPNAEREAARTWADSLCKGYRSHLHAEGLPEGAAAACGIAHFGAGTADLKRLGQLAERALTRLPGHDGAVVGIEEADPRAESQDIRNEIAAAITENRITLLGQKVMSLRDGSVLQLEILSSLTGRDGNAIAAGAFVPVANQHGLLPLLDRNVIEQVVRAIAQLNSLPRQISVNISMQSIADPGFRTTLRQLLARNRQSAERLVFEMTGYGASRSPDVAREFASDMHGLGAQVALDNFELERSAIALVHELLPAYVKLAPAFTQQIAARQDLRFIVEAMVRMLRPLEIDLIAQGVEDASSIPVLAQLGLSAYQGYAGGRPERLLR